ncbi:MAG: hypothetical protein LBR08_12990 [Bacteroidales bacterium]|nr:hypothetical protein [Bacteroidales bacterium]
MDDALFTAGAAKRRLRNGDTPSPRSPCGTALGYASAESVIPAGRGNVWMLFCP